MNDDDVNNYLDENYACTLDEIAAEFGVSRQRAADMCRNAYRSFRRELFKRLIEKNDIIPD